MPFLLGPNFFKPFERFGVLLCSQCYFAAANISFEQLIDVFSQGLDEMRAREKALEVTSSVL